MDPKNDESITALQPIEQKGLVIGNPVINKLARRFHWKPETVIARIKTALPAPVEQELFLAVGAENRMRPISLRIILRAYLGSRELQMYDLEGDNTLFDEVVSYLENVFDIIDKTSLEYEGLSLGMYTVSQLVIAYGDHTEEIIASVESSLAEFAEHLGVSHRSYARQMGICLHFLVWSILKYNHERGVPDPVDISEYFTDKTRLYRYTAQHLQGDDSALFYGPDIQLSEVDLGRLVSELSPLLFVWEIEDLLKGERRS